MKTSFKVTLLLLFFVFFTFQSCEDMDDVAPPPNLEINDFIWKGLNLYYLWQADVPNLSDARFANQAALNTFLNGYSEPEDLFDALRVNSSIDRFSWIVSDYLTLEGQLQGTTKNNGMDYILYYKSSSSDELVGSVRYIIPSSDASTKEIKRGALFYGINGTQLTKSNYLSLLSLENYTLNLADINNGSITPNGKSVNLTKTVLNENPIAVNKVIKADGHKIGYLMYNGFYPNYDTQLNDAFAVLKSQGVTDLVLDLRYNSGGSVQSATRLASMITGESTTGKVFSKERWNDKINSYFESEDPDALRNLFVDKIGSTPLNRLNLTKVYVLTTKSTASASELVINGLKPYIDVVQIGDLTTGKNVGSITIYDSPTFGKENRNPNHRYAMQPIVLKIVNANDFGDYLNGLTPTYTLKENITNLGELGNFEIKIINNKETLTSNDPLLDLAFAKITGRTTAATAKTKKNVPQIQFNYLGDSKSITSQNQMYLENAPAGILKSLE